MWSSERKETKVRLKTNQSLGLWLQYRVQYNTARTFLRQDICRQIKGFLIVTEMGASGNGTE